MVESLKKLIVQACSDQTAWEAKQELNELTCENSRLGYFLQLTFRNEILYRTYSEDVNNLLELGGQLCLLNQPGLRVTLYQTTQDGGIALFHNSPLGLLPNSL